MSFTKRKVSKNKYAFTFHKGYFERLCRAHPYVSNLLVSSIIKFNKSQGVEFFLNPSQEEVLSKRLVAYEKAKGSCSQAQLLLERWMVAGYRQLDVDLDKSPEILNEVYCLIYGKDFSCTN